MKLLLILIIACLNMTAFAQKKNVSISHTINDDVNILSIIIKGTVDGKLVDYNRSFNVAGQSKAQRDDIKRKVYDSLGLPDPVAPRAPLKPHTTMLVAPASPTEPAAPSTPPAVSSKSQYSEFQTIGGDHPYTKEIRYNPKTGLLYMKYHFIKNGEETTAEKSVELKDATKEERELIIKKYEKEIGIAQPEIV